MIYNLVALLQAQFPATQFVSDGLRADTPKEVVLVQQTGGTPGHWYDRVDHAVQFLSRAQTSLRAESNLRQIYEFLEKKFGLTLPEVTIATVVYPAVRTWQISPIQSPGALGADSEGLYLWSFNATVVTK